MKKIAIVLMCCMAISCEEKQDYIESLQRGNYKVDLLFTLDSCKMYRFNDGNRNVYWSTCAGKTQYNYTEQSGKNSVTKHQETLSN